MTIDLISVMLGMIAGLWGTVVFFGAYLGVKGGRGPKPKEVAFPSKPDFVQLKMDLLVLPKNMKSSEMMDFLGKKRKEFEQEWDAKQVDLAQKTKG